MALTGADNPAHYSNVTGQHEPVRNDPVIQHNTVDEAASNPLQFLLSNLPSELTTEQKITVTQLINSYADVFSKDDFDIGRTQLVQHRIDTGVSRPFRETLRRHPVAHLDTIDQQVQKMLQQDIIEPAASPWASNVVLVRKKMEVFDFA